MDALELGSPSGWSPWSVFCTGLGIAHTAMNDITGSVLVFFQGVSPIKTVIVSASSEHD